jgi:hypothetical protein
LKTTDRILEVITASPEPVTLKQIQVQLGLSPGILSGSLVHLCKSNRVAREKIERSSGTGPKQQWCYKLVDGSEKTE